MCFKRLNWYGVVYWIVGYTKTDKSLIFKQGLLYPPEDAVPFKERVHDAAGMLSGTC